MQSIFQLKKLALSRMIGMLICSLLSQMSFSQNNNWEELAVPFPVLGKIAPKNVKIVTASPWSVGGETMDRDYTIYNNWKGYIENLGIKKVRLQSGWAKTEKIKGKYNFAWLDSVVYDLHRKGIEPWISISYGNPIYRGGGGTLLGAKLPNDGEAYEGWKNYTIAIVERYKNIVDEWEIWNEPNGHNPAEDYAKLLYESGKVIKKIQPNAVIIGMAIAGIQPKWAGEVLQSLKAKNGLSYLDVITYHPYNSNPDNSYKEVMVLRDTVQKYSTAITLFQGENGAPSEFRKTKALREYNWTELSQAKWALRRMLGDWGRDIPSSIFSICDLHYPDEINRKGLLLTDENQQVVRPKHAYYAVQHLASVFDYSLLRIKDYPVQYNTFHGLSLFAYEKENTGQQVVTIWFNDNIPSDYNSNTLVDFTFSNGKFESPVYVDLRTGYVYKIPKSQWRKETVGYTFFDIPVYDSPILIADLSAISLQ